MSSKPFCKGLDAIHPDLGGDWQGWFGATVTSGCRILSRDHKEPSSGQFKCLPLYWDVHRWDVLDQKENELRAVYSIWLPTAAGAVSIPWFEFP